MDQAVRAMHGRMDEQHKRLDGLHAALTTALERLLTIERLITMQRTPIKLTGLGPTER